MNVIETRSLTKTYGEADGPSTPSTHAGARR